jgi:hypothetical protein
VAERVTDWVDSPARGEVPSRRRSEGDEGSGVRPPRWSFPLCGTRLRISVGMGAWLVAAAGALAWSPATPVAWLPLLVVLSVAVSKLVHEGAHAWAAHNLGYRVEWVVLGGLAGVTAYFGRDDRPLDRAAVALAGPAASAALVVGLLAVRASLPTGADLTTLIEMVLVFNAASLVGNLLPLGQTDGARTLGGVFEHMRSRRSG